MTRLLNIFFDIIRLRRGPQDLPGSWGFTVMLLVPYLWTAVTINDQLAIRAGEQAQPMIPVTVVILHVMVLAVILNIRKMPLRLPQTLSATYGVGLIFSAVLFALELQSNREVQQPFLLFVFLTLIIWSLVVDGHIYRHSLNITQQQGTLLALILMISSYVFVALFLAPALGSS